MELKLWHVGAAVGGLVAVAGLLHLAAGPDDTAEKKRPAKKPAGADAKAVAATRPAGPPPPPPPAAKPQPMPAPVSGMARPKVLVDAALVGSAGEAQYKDGFWYSADKLEKSDLGDPAAVRWAAGTLPANANPATGTSPALAWRRGGDGGAAVPPAASGAAPSLPGSAAASAGGGATLAPRAGGASVADRLLGLAAPGGGPGVALGEWLSGADKKNDDQPAGKPAGGD